MKRLYIYLLLIVNLLSCKGWSQEEKTSILYINENIVSNNYEIIRLSSKEINLLRLNYIPTERGRNYIEQKKEHEEKKKLIYFYRDKLIYQYSISDNNNYKNVYTNTYNVYSKNKDSIEGGGRIQFNGTIKRSEYFSNWLLTDDKHYYPIIKYPIDTVLSQNYVDFLKEMYKKAEATDYTDFEFSYYIPPTWHIVENRDRRQYPQEYMEKNFPVKQGKDAGFVDFKFPEAEKYYKELAEDNYQIISEKDIEAAQQIFPDNKEKRETYIYLKTIFYKTYYVELQMPKETIKFKYNISKNLKIKFFGNEELYKKGILFVYIQNSFSLVPNSGGLYVIRPKS